jgi:hypothetical protein
MRVTASCRRFGTTLALIAMAGCGQGEDDRVRARRERPDPRAPRVGRAGPCGYRAAARLTGDGIGELIVGRRVGELAGECRVVSDTVDPFGAEGRPKRVLRVELGPDTVTVEVGIDRVYRLDVRSLRIRTVDGFGPGSTLGELLEVQDLRGAYGEGSLYALSPSHCGLSFDLGPPPPDRAGTRWTRGALAELPDSLPVRRVLAVGCTH